MFKILESIPKRALIDAFGTPAHKPTPEPIIVRVRVDHTLKDNELIKERMRCNVRALHRI